MERKEGVQHVREWKVVDRCERWQSVCLDCQPQTDSTVHETFRKCLAEGLATCTQGHSDGLSPPPYTHTHNFTHLVELLYSPDEQWVTGGVFKVNIICREEKKKEKKESSRQWWCRVYSSAPGVLSSRELQAICYIGELKAEELPGTRITYCCKK